MSMSKGVSTLMSNRKIDSSRWDEAIRDAEGEIRALTRQRNRLQQAIRIFKQNKCDRMEWPGSGKLRKARKEPVVGQDR